MACLAGCSSAWDFKGLFEDSCENTKVQVAALIGSCRN